MAAKPNPYDAARRKQHPVTFTPAPKVQTVKVPARKKGK
jgi:hypothetical protein